LPPPPARTPTRPRMLPAAALAIALVALVIRGLGSGSGPSLPFLAVGEIHVGVPPASASPSLVLRDMLATSLGTIEGLRVVANSRLVELIPRGPDPAPSAITDAARRA